VQYKGAWYYKINLVLNHFFFVFICCKLNFRLMHADVGAWLREGFKVYKTTNLWPHSPVHASNRMQGFDRQVRVWNNSIIEPMWVCG
jgi:hypothetical protein